MVLSRDDILAASDVSGREMLQLLTLPKETEDAGAAVQGRSLGKNGPDAVGATLENPGDFTLPGLPLTSFRAIEQQLRYASNHDPLTGLFNRSHLQDVFRDTIIAAGDRGTKVAFILMDLDHFKDLNGALGHRAGDVLLIEVAKRIQSLVRPGDVVGRLGGDEFAIIMPNLASERDAAGAMAGMLETVAEAVTQLNSRLHSAASMGLAIFPDHGSDPEELMRNADIALYRAKGDGRGRSQVFGPHLRQGVLERLDHLSRFRSALTSGGVKPFYQPQMRLSDRRSYGFEALARWVLPDGEILYPSHFQMALKDPYTAILLGEHMLTRISDDLRAWREANMPACKVSINVTGPEIKQGDYPEKIADVFTARKLPFSQLTVEITESVLLDENADLVAKTLSSLRKLGVSISLDDFGTGFASLTHLKSFAVDQIKIDRSFIADLPSNPDDWSIVRATLGLAKSLGIQTVAEGLEDARQLKCLQALGCDYGQGFFFSPAVPSNEAEAYFKLHRAYRKAQLHQFVLPTQTSRPIGNAG